MGPQAGFTLIELTVSLVAGLIVALGIVGLSREATRTFHEEVRSSVAEATLRTAVDRLRGDLQRAGYMSTPNIVSDPHVAHAFGATNVSTINVAMLGLLRLAGIYLDPAGSAVGLLGPSTQQPSPLSPDAIEIGGNMTSSEQFEVQTLQVPSPASANCTRITLSVNSPALYRVMSVGAAAQSAEMNNIFQPDGASQFIIRLVDDTGRSQFLATCPGTPTAGITAGTGWVDFAENLTPHLTPQQTNSLGGVTTTPGGGAYVNPVQIVRWEIVPSTAEPAQYQNALDSVSLQAGVQDASKFDLVRSFVDAGTGKPIQATMEVVAEYAVDLKFAFSVESTPAQNGLFPVMSTFSFDDTVNNLLWAAKLQVPAVPTTQPQRIRVVRARVVTRTAQPDRAVNVGLQPGNFASTSGGLQAFLYRYCLVAPCANQDDTLRWARTRTITTEVSVPNQEQAFF